MPKAKKITLTTLALLGAFLILLGVHNNRFMRALPWVISKWPIPLTRDILIRLIDSNDEEVAMWATHNLVNYSDNIATIALVKAMNHKAPMVRHNAINSIIFSGRANLAVEQAIARINDPNEEIWVTESAIALLGNIDELSKRKVALGALSSFIENKRRIRPLSQTDNNAIYYAKGAINKLSKTDTK